MYIDIYLPEDNRVIFHCKAVSLEVDRESFVVHFQTRDGELGNEVIYMRELPIGAIMHIEFEAKESTKHEC